MAKTFTHPNFGKEVRIEQYGKEVHLIFVANTIGQADSAATELLRQLKSGILNITLAGKPTSVEGE